MQIYKPPPFQHNFNYSWYIYLAPTSSAKQESLKSTTHRSMPSLY